MPSHSHDRNQGRLPLTILVLEDDPADVRHLKWQFARVGRFDIQPTFVDSVSDAVRECIATNFDVLICDFWLGSESSLEFVRRTGGGLNGVPVVLITSLTNQDIRKLGFNAGACAFLSKHDLSGGTIETAIETAIHGASSLAILKSKLDDSYDGAELGALLEDIFLGLHQVEQLISSPGENTGDEAAYQIADMKERCARLAMRVGGRTDRENSEVSRETSPLSKPSLTSLHDAARMAKIKTIN